MRGSVTKEAVPSNDLSATQRLCSPAFHLDEVWKPTRIGGILYCFAGTPPNAASPSASHAADRSLSFVPPRERSSRPLRNDAAMHRG
jgi:hypothetical protein